MREVTAVETMTMKKNQGKLRWLSLCLALCLMATAVLGTGAPAQAKKKSTSSVFKAVKNAYSSSFPLSDNNMIKTDRKNIFGSYSTVLGVSAKLFSKYTAAQKSNSKEEYICFICKATSKSNVKKIKKAMKKYVVNEYKSNLSYHSDHGKTLLKKAKVGSKGKYVYLFVLDTSNNKKAISAFKKSLS